MKILGQIPEDEFVSVFLQSEINSRRFGKRIAKALKNKPKRIITAPHLRNKHENQLRRKILGEVRGFGRNKDLFENFPSNTRWYRATLSQQELKRVKYINYDYWNDLSNHSRLPIKAAKNIHADVKIFGVSNNIFRDIFSEIKKGKTFPPIILVAKNKRSRLVILEGHARMTAYFLDSHHLPREMEVIVGFSNKMDAWDLY